MNTNWKRPTLNLSLNCSLSLLKNHVSAWTNLSTFPLLSSLYAPNYWNFYSWSFFQRFMEKQLIFQAIFLSHNKNMLTMPLQKYLKVSNHFLFLKNEVLFIFIILSKKRKIWIVLLGKMLLKYLNPLPHYYAFGKLSFKETNC